VNTSRLQIGQEVGMDSGIAYCTGKVVRVTVQGVDVQTLDGEVYQFDCLGNSRDGHRFEGQPWEIVIPE
jgi:hypothetical protein